MHGHPEKDKDHQFNAAKILDREFNFTDNMTTLRLDRRHPNIKAIQKRLRRMVFNKHCWDLVSRQRCSELRDAFGFDSNLYLFCLRKLEMVLEDLAEE